jgi:AcrB/AcrD/AcrF family
MIVGMIPMAIGGAGEEQNAALARAVIGGLLFATPTTLLAVPCLFAMLSCSLSIMWCVSAGAKRLPAESHALPSGFTSLTIPFSG